MLIKVFLIVAITDVIALIMGKKFLDWYFREMEAKLTTMAIEVIGGMVQEHLKTLTDYSNKINEDYRERLFKDYLNIKSEK